MGLTRWPPTKVRENVTSQPPKPLDLPLDELKSYFLAVGGLGPSEKGVEPSAVQHENEAGRLCAKTLRAYA